MIKAIYHKIKMKEQLNDFELEVPFDFSTDLYRDINQKLFTVYLQYNNNPSNIFDNFYINKISRNVENIEGFKVPTYTICFNNDKSIMFGAHAIMECIAHILEKECYNINDNRIYLPYDLPLKIAEYNGLNFKDKAWLIDLCEYSLMFFNPSEVFMYLLQCIRDEEYIPVNSNEFYNYMKEHISVPDQTIEEFYLHEKNELLANINGVFVSELYDGYKKWLNAIIENGYSFKKNNELFFSKLLSCDPNKFLYDSIVKMGMPPIFNQDGKMFIRNSDFDVDSGNFLSRAIYSVFQTLSYGKESCILKEACLMTNEMRDKKININDNCDFEPWERIKIENEELCPFCAVWQTFGLSKIRLVIRSRNGTLE